MNSEAPISGHISKRFDQELEDIRNKVLTMGGLVETQVNDGIKCLIDSDSELARKMVEKDRQVNRMEMEIDNRCLQILARRQPAASDLRLVVAIMKTIGELERIGDQAQKLGKHQIELIDAGVSAASFAKIGHLGDLVSNNLNRALDAFARMNVKDAMDTIALDTKVDAEFEGLTRELITHMMEDPRTIKSALRVSWSARALERIGDHANNICEYVVFLVQGKDVRHIDAIDKLDL
jgi:phosphate transport system protein